MNIVHPDAVFDTGLWTDEIIAERAARYGLTVDAYKRRNLLGAEVAVGRRRRSRGRAVHGHLPRAQPARRYRSTAATTGSCEQLMSDHGDVSAAAALALGAATLGESGAVRLDDGPGPIWPGAAVAGPARTVCCSPGTIWRSMRPRRAHREVMSWSSRRAVRSVSAIGVKS